MFYLNQCQHAISGAWRAYPSITRADCPDSVVSGNDVQSVLGYCARTKKDSNNGLISYLCGSALTSTTDYICQKEKEGNYFAHPILYQV